MARAKAATAPTVAEPRQPYPLRKRTGTAAFHTSAAAVDIGMEDLEKLSPKEVVMVFADARWGNTKEMPCPHCGTFDTHYWRPSDLRWKCKGCGSTFTVTSGTVLAGHKLPLHKILKIAYAWGNGASGVPALQLRRDWKVSYLTIFTLLHKLREGLSRGFNCGMLAGVTEMDGMDVNGRNYKDKRNKPQTGWPKTGPAIPEELLKSAQDAPGFIGPPTPPKWGKAAKQNPHRRQMLVVRQRGMSKGTGAAATRVSIAITESGSTVMAMARKFISSESVVMSDEDPSYGAFERWCAGHLTVCHSASFSDGKGVNNNQAESFNWRMRRGVEGIYLNPSNKFLHEYASEAAWREDCRRLPTGQKLKNMLRTVTFVGESQFWQGYSHGQHRTEELLIDGARPAPARGRPKGWEPRPPR